ncbi:MAG TPA: ROK family transcriptional regulator [Acidimicrobiales bacterium]
MPEGETHGGHRGDDEPFGRRGRTARRAVPGDARRHNRRLVLRTLFRDGPLSRADLARATHLTRVTASDLVAELLDEGLIEELGTREGQGVGKPATMLGIVAQSRLVLSLDLSGDEEFLAALVDLHGKVIDRQEVAHGDRTGQEAVDLAAGLLTDLASRAGSPLVGVGVGSPGLVDPAGTVLEAPNLGWYGVDVGRQLGEAVGGTVPIHVANDANAAALGELSLAGPLDRSLLLIRIGHGVGAGVVIDGHLVIGDRFAAGEIGHVVVDPRGEPCACGRRGCLETAIAGRMRGRLAGTGAAQSRARQAAGRKLGLALAPVVSALNLREVVLSGPLDVLDETFRHAALRAVQSRTMPAVGDIVDIRPSPLGEDDVLLGAAMLVLDRELGVA